MHRATEHAKEGARSALFALTGSNAATLAIAVWFRVRSASGELSSGGGKRSVGGIDELVIQVGKKVDGWRGGGEAFIPGYVD
jgi:hypothetical protein